MKRLGMAIRAKGLTHKDIGKLVGLHPSDISRLVHGRIRGHPAWWTRMAELLGVPEEDLQREVTVDGR